MRPIFIASQALKLILTFCLSFSSRALRKLQKTGHIPDDPTLLKEYASNAHNFDAVRMCAFELLVDSLWARADDHLLAFLYDAIERDHSRCVRRHIAACLCQGAPFKFTFEEGGVRAELLVHRLWSLMAKFALDWRLKAALAKLYQLLYGFSKPKCLRQVMRPFGEAVEAIVF